MRSLIIAYIPSNSIHPALFRVRIPSTWALGQMQLRINTIANANRWRTFFCHAEEEIPTTTYSQSPSHTAARDCNHCNPNHDQLMVFFPHAWSGDRRANWLWERGYTHRQMIDMSSTPTSVAYHLHVTEE